MDATKLQEIEAQLDELACSDHGCVVSKPRGMGTNGGCLCVPHGIHPDQRVALRKALTLRQKQADALVAEVRRLTAALATARREGAEGMRRAAGQVCHDVYLEDPSAAVAVCIDAIRALPLDAPGGAT